ncbi:ESCRT II complex subunit Dot2 [Microbotryomycetes sp. JL221]|nr:ESCRT II complex subunit Dot2 [Microbotryomycetes sp. JL221]
MSRRGVGYSSLQRHIDTANSFSTLSNSLAEQQTQALNSSLATFQQALSTFSTHHRQKILSSPEFRSHFTQLCRELGVDPLGGASKGIWDKVGLGDWYFALGVQIVDVCLQLRDRNGGLVALDEVIHNVMALRTGRNTTNSTFVAPSASTTPASGNPLSSAKRAPLANNASAAISEADVQRAIDSLEPLGSGYAILNVGNKKVVRCAPGGLDSDSLIVIEAAGDKGTNTGVVTLGDVQAFTEQTGLSWNLGRTERAIDKAVLDEGVAWVDDQGSHGRQYWIPALFDFAEDI